jgi:hypothetical protein
MSTYEYMENKAELLARKVLRTAEIVQGWEPTGSFPFVRLPKKLRDCIYDYAFSPLPTIFRTGGLLVQASRKGSKSKDEDWNIYYHNFIPAFTTGLPHWLLASKQICSEALSYFGTMRTLTAANHF